MMKGNKSRGRDEIVMKVILAPRQWRPDRVDRVDKV